MLTLRKNKDSVKVRKDNNLFIYSESDKIAQNEDKQHSYYLKSAAKASKTITRFSKNNHKNSQEKAT